MIPSPQRVFNRRQSLAPVVLPHSAVGDVELAKLSPRKGVSLPLLRQQTCSETLGKCCRLVAVGSPESHSCPPDRLVQISVGGSTDLPVAHRSKTAPAGFSAWAPTEARLFGGRSPGQLSAATARFLGMDFCPGSGLGLTGIAFVAGSGAKRILELLQWTAG